MEFNQGKCQIKPDARVQLQGARPRQTRLAGME